MKTLQTINKLFALCFMLLGLLALYAALFLGSTHHYGTLILCILMIIVMLKADRKKQK